MGRACLDNLLGFWMRLPRADAVSPCKNRSPQSLARRCEVRAHLQRKTYRQRRSAGGHLTRQLLTVRLSRCTTISLRKIIYNHLKAFTHRADNCGAIFERFGSYTKAGDLSRLAVSVVHVQCLSSDMLLAVSCPLALQPPAESIAELALSL